MAKSVYFNNCIRAIRQTVYGRDNRKPIADCLLTLEHDIEVLYSTTAGVEAVSKNKEVNEFLKSIRDSMTPYSSTSAELLSGNDYRLTIIS